MRRPAELSVHEAPRKEHLQELIKQAHREGRTLLNEQESKAFLSNYGIPTTTPHVTRHVGEAPAIAQGIGYPVAIKIVSPDILDRSDIGGVVLWIDSDEQLTQAYESMLTRVKERAPQACIEGVSIQKMIEDIEYELILGSAKHKDFGAVILFGMGGTATELIGDFSIALPPLNQTLARRLMEETKAYKAHSKPARKAAGQPRETGSGTRQLLQSCRGFSRNSGNRHKPVGHIRRHTARSFCKDYSRQELCRVSPTLFTLGHHSVPDAIRRAMENLRRHRGAVTTDQTRG